MLNSSRESVANIRHEVAVNNFYYKELLASLPVFFIISLSYPPDACAYIGPGLGAGAVAAVLGIVSGLLMLVVGVVWYPLKRLIRYLKLKK